MTMTHLFLLEAVLFLVLVIVTESYNYKKTRNFKFYGTRQDYRKLKTMLSERLKDDVNFLNREYEDGRISLDTYNNMIRRMIQNRGL